MRFRSNKIFGLVLVKLWPILLGFLWKLRIFQPFVLWFVLRFRLGQYIEYEFLQFSAYFSIHTRVEFWLDSKFRIVACLLKCAFLPVSAICLNYCNRLYARDNLSTFRWIGFRFVPAPAFKVILVSFRPCSKSLCVNVVSFWFNIVCNPLCFNLCLVGPSLSTSRCLVLTPRICKKKQLNQIKILDFTQEIRIFTKIWFYCQLHSLKYSPIANKPCLLFDLVREIDAVIIYLWKFPILVYYPLNLRVRVYLYDMLELT